MKIQFEKNKTDILWALLGGVVFSAIFVLGFSLETYKNVDYKNPWIWIMLLLCSIIFGSLFFFLFMVRLPNTKNWNVRFKSPFRFFLLVFAILSVVYGIWALGVYPGFFAYDAPWQWFMYSSGEITEHHPVLHTLLIGWFLELGKNLTGTINKGAFLYTIFQTGLTVASFSYALTFICYRWRSRKLFAFSFAWFALAPTVVINVMSVTKDSMFAMLTLPFVILTIQMTENPEAFFGKWTKAVSWGGLALLSVIMRNNAIYPMVFLLVILLWVNRKAWKRYLTVLLCIGILFTLYTGPFCDAVTVSRLDEEEFYSIPLQQMLWVYMNDREEMTDEEISMVEEVFEPICFELYNPKISDIPKYNSDLERLNWGEWFALGMHFPADYLNAFLVNNFGLWYPWASLVVDQYGTEAYLICRSYDPIFDDSLIPPIYSYLSIFEDSDMVLRNDWTRWIFAPGTCVCFFLAVFLWSLARKKKAALALGYLFIFWLTYLLGPVALVRYVSYLFYLVPILVGVLRHE